MNYRAGGKRAFDQIASFFFLFLIKHTHTRKQKENPYMAICFSFTVVLEIVYEQTQRFSVLIHPSIQQRSFLQQVCRELLRQLLEQVGRAVQIRRAEQLSKGRPELDDLGR